MTTLEVRRIGAVDLALQDAANQKGHMPMKYEKEIAALKMTERMWDDLMDELDPEEYARIAKEYEGRKASLCHCSAQWGLCPHYNGSRCTYSDSCKYKC